MRRRELLGISAASTVPLFRVWAQATERGPAFDVTRFGAGGDGRTLDTPAVNRAIAAAVTAGGGTVRFPAGTYACHSIRLQSFVALYLEPGATILAAAVGGYDAAESNAPWESYQDFGHNHWHNSLIWGERIHDVGIFGPGLIWGQGLSRGEVAENGLPPANTKGAADKAIAFKHCHNVTLRDIAIRAAGHFGILASGVDNLTLDHLKIDTNRDGMNIDCCRNVRISGCSVNSPSDDGICLKSSFALGEARATENVTISDCYVTGGWQVGTMLDGTFKRFDSEDPGGPTGRIKCGTESNGGFRNIAISNCLFESCRGLALESVDGGPLEDITFTGITMRDIRNAPFFMRLGGRLRGPPGRSVGKFRRVIISNIICEAPGNDMPAIITGIPGHPVEDISINDVYLMQKGGGAAALAAINPPELERDYPEPNRLGPLPAQGLFVRHARNLDVRHVEIAHVADDARPCIWLNDVDEADFVGLKLPPGGRASAFSVHQSRRLHISGSAPLADVSWDYIASAQLP